MADFWLKSVFSVGLGHLSAFLISTGAKLNWITELFGSSAVTVTKKTQSPFCFVCVLFFWYCSWLPPWSSSGPLYSRCTSTPAVLENNLDSVLSDHSLQRKPHTHTHIHTSSQTNTTTPAPWVSLMNRLASEGIPCKTAAIGRELLGRKQEMLSWQCEWSFPLWWDRLEIASHDRCQ